jgi:hypothetical protein
VDRLVELRAGQGALADPGAGGDCAGRLVVLPRNLAELDEEAAIYRQRTLPRKADSQPAAPGRAAVVLTMREYYGDNGSTTS